MLQSGENRIRVVQIRLGPGGGGHGRASGLSNQGPGKCFGHGFLTITRKAQHFITADSASHVGGRQVNDVDRSMAWLGRPGEEKE